jgi:hypothetical protein
MSNMVVFTRQGSGCSWHSKIECKAHDHHVTKNTVPAYRSLLYVEQRLQTAASRVANKARFRLTLESGPEVVKRRRRRVREPNRRSSCLRPRTVRLCAAGMARWNVALIGGLECWGGFRLCLGYWGTAEVAAFMETGGRSAELTRGRSRRGGSPASMHGAP